MLSSFLEELTEEQRQNIKCVKGDGAKRIDACIKKSIPFATRWVDTFPVFCWTNDALDVLCKETCMRLKTLYEKSRKRLKVEKEDFQNLIIKLGTNSDDKESFNIYSFSHLVHNYTRRVKKAPVFVRNRCLDKIYNIYKLIKS